jgi:Site-specific DNA methylase
MIVGNTQSGRYSPLRYPGGKGKVARFVRQIIRENGLSDGHYVEPYAGGASVAWELLLTGIVRRVTINDISRPVFAFWNSVLWNTERLCAWIDQCPLTVEQWDSCKNVLRDPDIHDDLALACSFFYLNRTNRSGIINGGIIGGRSQMGPWKIDARFNKAELISRIRKIANMRSRIEVYNLDAVVFLSGKYRSWRPNTLVYVDPPYFEKGRYLYLDAYKPKDHQYIAETMMGIKNLPWIVSYDDVRPIHDLYHEKSWLQYTLNYSARNKTRGREAMFFSDGLRIPDVTAPLVELDRDYAASSRSVESRSFAA